MLGGILMQRFAMTTSLPVGSMVNGDNKAAASLPLKGPCPSGCAGVTVCSALTSRSCAQLAVYSCRGWSQASLCLRGFTSGICRLWEKKEKKPVIYLLYFCFQLTIWIQWIQFCYRSGHSFSLLEHKWKLRLNKTWNDTVEFGHALQLLNTRWQYTF